MRAEYAGRGSSEFESERRGAFPRAIKNRGIEIVLTSDPDQREQRITPGIGEGGSHSMRRGVPRRSKVRLRPSSASSEGCNLVATHDLRTRSKPVDKEA